MSAPCLPATTMPSTSTSGYTPFGVFAKFPQEVRDLIYGLVLADGQNALIRTSKAMYANTAQSLSKHGVYCAHIEHYRHLPRNICTHCRPLAWKILSAVQNFHLHLTIGGKSLWDKKHHDPAYATNLLTIFMRDIVNAMKNPVYCKLSLEMMHPDRLGTPILRMISALKVFKEVKVEVST